MDGAEINYRRLLMLIDEAGGVASISRAVGHKTSSTLSQYKGRAADSKTGKPKRLGRGLVRDLKEFNRYAGDPYITGVRDTTRVYASIHE